MSITIKKQPKPQLPQCIMSCDKPLHPKLDDYPMSSCCLQSHSTTAIIGKPKSGKSSMLYSWFKTKKLLRKCFDKIYYIAPANSMESMSDNIFGKHLPDDQIYHELTADILDEIIEKCMNREEGDKIAIIIDDMGSQCKRSDVQIRLKKIAQNKRHMGIYQTFFLIQTWKSCPFEIRRLYDNIFMFKCSANEMDSLITEVLPHMKPYAETLQKAVYDKPHNYLGINTASGKLFKNWDEINVNED